MLNIYEQENVFVERAKQAIFNGMHIYIYGCGQMGKIEYAVFKNFNIEVIGFVVDKDYYQENRSFCQLPVFCIEDILENDLKSYIIVAHRDYDPQKYPLYESRICCGDIFSLHSVDETCMDFDFIMENRTRLEAFMDILQDEKSKICMEAYINQKISGKLHYLETLYEENQYYDADIVNFEEIHALVDCGAYDGDSWLSFLKNYETDSRKYEGKAYLLEPDKNNFKKLEKTCGNDTRCRLYNMGAWHEKGILAFSESGTSSGILENGDMSICVDEIDNIAEEKIDFIKMDIEGAEYNALLGAQECIQQNHPVLAVCVYHKRRDLLDIPDLIKAICPKYEFYLRAYSKYSQELVLYAVCKE